MYYDFTLVVLYFKIISNDNRAQAIPLPPPSPPIVLTISSRDCVQTKIAKAEQDAMQIGNREQ